jgi:hypothetical protein
VVSSHEDFEFRLGIALEDFVADSNEVFFFHDSHFLSFALRSYLVPFGNAININPINDFVNTI